MAITYKDINLLTQKPSVAGTEKLPVSDTQYITPAQITSGLAVDSGLVHTTGNETIAGTKTFTGQIELDDSNSTVCNLQVTGFGWIQDENNNSVQDALDAKQATLVSGTNIKTINNSSILGSGNLSVTADTSSCVHLTGDETIADDKTFTDNIAVVDADHILYSSGGGSGFTRGATMKQLSVAANSVTFTGLSGEPKAFVVSLTWNGLPDNGQSCVVSLVGDSTGCHGIYTTGSQHNYSASFTKSYSSGSLTITAPTGQTFLAAVYSLVYYYGDGALTFHTKSINPGSGVTSVTFTDTPLTETPAMYACMLESAVNIESYRRVALYTNSVFEEDEAVVLPIGLTFYTSNPAADTTTSFSVSYSSGLVINSGGMNAGGYFHNPGTYTLYYLMASDVAGGGGYSSLGDELDAIRTDIGDIQTLLEAI